jgi:hypothetical protein
MAPIAKTHHPSTVDAAMLSTATTAASTSMSKRAPRSLTVLVARATGPSTASSIKATVAGTTSHHDRTERSDTKDATTIARHTPPSPARVAVTRSAALTTQSR